MPATIMRVAKVKDRTAIAVCHRWQWVTCMQAGTLSGPSFPAHLLSQYTLRMPKYSAGTEIESSQH